MSHSKLRTLNHIHAVIQIISHVIFAANSKYFVGICSSDDETDKAAPDSSTLYVVDENLNVYYESIRLRDRDTYI